MLACHLGLIHKVKLTTYQFTYDNVWGPCRWLDLLEARTHQALQKLIPKKIPVTLVDDDREIIEREKSGRQWCHLYELKYNFPISDPQALEEDLNGGWGPGWDDF